MAAFHFTAKIHSRAKGASAVRAAAYRAAERLVDVRAGKIEDYSRKSDVAESAILAPFGSPAWVQDRADLWNRVEAREKRRDAQLAQELEINLPRELTEAQNWRLITDFAREHLVAHGRVCDIAMHVGEASDGERHPHAHILMPLRCLEGESFGEKHPDCDWRTFVHRRDRLEDLRAAWCEFARSRAAELGVDLGADWDHRSLAERGIDLEAQPKLGATAQRLQAEGQGADRAAALEETRRRNGERLQRDPSIVLTALTRQQSTFTERDLARWVHRHAADDQFPSIMDQCRARAVRVGVDEQKRERFSTPEMIAIEKRMIREAQELRGRGDHQVSRSTLERVLRGSRLSEEQQDAARHLVGAGDIACLIGYAGAGKSTMLAEARKAWEAAGYQVRGATLSGIAAENLEAGSGIESRTIRSLEYSWQEGRSQLGRGDVLVIDEAGMVGSRDLARLITQAGDRGAKIVLVGDPEQLQAIDAGAAFRAIADRVHAAELTEIRRQLEPWQADATRDLATGRTAAALERYRANGRITAAESDQDAQARLIEAWKASRAASPDRTRIMLAHTRADVRALNEAARAELVGLDELGEGRRLQTSRGEREFAAGDRLLFLQNDRGLGVKNGTIGTVTAMGEGHLQVRADDGRTITFDPSAYQEFDHGYASTVHKAQGVTVDESFVLATRGFDRHLAYVALSRHRSQTMMIHSRDTFADDAELAEVLGRQRAKDTTLDYREATIPRLAAPVPAPRPTAEFIQACEPQAPKTIRELIEALREQERAAHRPSPGIQGRSDIELER